MPGGLATGHVRPPGNEPALGKLDDGVLPDPASAQGHREYLADGAHSLPDGGILEVVVPIPARLLRRIGDAFEDRRGSGSDLPFGAHDAWWLRVGHFCIEPLVRSPRPAVLWRPNR